MLTIKNSEVNKNRNITEFDKIKLSEERDKLLNLFNNHKKEVMKFQNYKELPIEVELLIQSQQGINILKKKFAIMTNQFFSEKNRRRVFENEFKELIPDIFKTNFQKNKFEFLNRASQELDFHIKRFSDMIPLTKSYEQRFQNNKSIIENLEKNISFYVEKKKEKAINSIDNFNAEVKKLNIEKNILLEKKKQLSIYNHLFHKEISDFEKMMYFENKMMSSNNKNHDYKLISYLYKIDFLCNIYFN